MRRKNYAFIALVFAFTVYTQSASAQIFRWVNRAGGSGTDKGNGIVADKTGNLYITGSFSTTAYFGKDSLVSNGSTDAYIAKYNNSGHIIWVKDIGGSGADEGNAIAIDSLGYIYITGDFSGTVVFNSTTTLISKGKTDAFIVKYDTSGNQQWAASQGGAGSDDGNGIAVDNSGNVYVTGLDNGATISLAKYTGAGVQSWYKTIGSGSFNDGESVSVDDSANIYITGEYNGYVFAGKYDNTGKQKWMKQGGDGSLDYGYGITLDNNANVYITGEFTTTGTTYVDKTQVTSQGQEDILLWKLSRGGVTSFVKTAGGANNDEGRGISIGNKGDIYITGFYNGTAKFDTGHLTGPTSDQIFIAKYNKAGNFEWAKKGGGIGVTTNIGHSIFIDDSSNVCVTGEFSSSAAFEQDTLTTPSKVIASDIFLIKYSDIPTWDSAYFTVSDTFECFTNNKFTFTSTSKTNNGKLSYLWEFGDGKTSSGTTFIAAHAYAAGGFYNVTLVASTVNGYKDSVSHILHVDQPTPGLVYLGNGHWGTDSFATYQWYIGGNTIIKGDSFRILSKPVKGNEYTVLVTDSRGCSTHSGLFTYTGSGISPVIYNWLSVYPNPTDGSFIVEKPSATETIDNIAIYNMVGKEVYYETSNSLLSQDKIKITIAEKGIYIIKLQSGGSVYEQKIMVQ